MTSTLPARGPRPPARWWHRWVKPRCLFVGCRRPVFDTTGACAAHLDAAIAEWEQGR